MKRLALCLALLMVTASARDARGQGGPGPLAAAIEEAAVAAGPPAARAQAQPEPTPPPPPRPRRRGSMVGYIEDAVIGSKIRVRFDSAAETRVPDRAEFFYAKCGCYADLGADHPLYDPDAPGPRPGLATDLNFQQLLVWGEYAFGNRVSVVGQVPTRWIQPQAFADGASGFENQSGLSDIRAGLKLGLLASDAQSLTTQVQVQFPSGEAERGMGTAHTTIEPAILYLQRLGQVVTLESQLGLWAPLDGSAPVPVDNDGEFSGDILFYGVGPSFTLYDNDRVQFAPIVEIVGWRVLNGYQSDAVTDASGTNIVNLKVGARANFPAGSIYVGAGKALTDETWYDDILRIEYRYSF